MREINGLCTLNALAPLVDDAEDSFKCSKRVQFEHFIRAPASLEVKLPVELVFDSIVIRAKEMKCKVELLRANRRQLLETVDFGSTLETVKICRPNCSNQIKTDRSVPLPKCHHRKVDVIRVTVIRAPSRTISFETVKVYCPLTSKLSTQLDKLSKVEAGFYGCSTTDEVEMRHPTAGEEPVTAQTKKKLTTVHDMDLPSWLLCSITHSVMRNPIQLPSGHWVDQTTVDKWRLSNLCFSADVTDPFTGVKLKPSDLVVCSQRQQQIVDFFINPR